MFPKRYIFLAIIAVCVMVGMPLQANANTLGDIARMVNGQSVVQSTNNANATTNPKNKVQSAAMIAPMPNRNRATQSHTPAKWQNIKQFMARDADQFVACMGDKSACDGQMMHLWHRLMALAAPMDQSDQLRVVNRFFNAIAYKTDRQTYGQSEYWATPVEFMTYGGDCEDYAIAKYFTLRLLGVSDRDMRITNVYDTLRQIGHSVVAVRSGSKLVYLDNRTNGIFNADLYQHYTPYYSVNQSATIQHVSYRPVAGR